MRAWLARNSRRKPVSVANECGVLRQFCIYRATHNPSAFVPGRSWAPQSTTSDFLPHVLTQVEVRSVLRVAGGLRPRFRAQLYRALLLVLYCTGVRFGEAVRLRIGDVDLHKGVLFIAPSKGRSRWVPFNGSLARELRRYLAARRAVSAARSGDPFFVRPGGRPLRTNRASDTVRCSCGWPASSRLADAPVPARTISVTPSPSIGCSAGTAPASTFTLDSPGSPRTWGMTTFSGQKRT